MSLSYKYTIDSEPKEYDQILKFQIPDKSEIEIKNYIIDLIQEDLKK